MMNMESKLKEINDKSFLLDEMYTDDQHYKRLNPIDKFFYYRKGIDHETGKQSGIDIDVCIYNILIYIKNHSSILGDSFNLSIVSQGGKKCEIKTQEGLTFRGDTAINCFNAIMQIVNENSKIKLNRKSNIEEIRKCLYGSGMFQSEKMKELLEKHVMLCYGIGNFYLIPCSQGNSLNIAKGRLKTKGYSGFLYDDMYTFLQVMRNYFIYGINDSCELIKIINSQYASYWSKWFGSGEEGWIKFIDEFCFNAFVNEQNKPIQFWEKTSGLEEDLKKYLIKINDALEKRAKDICTKLATSNVNLNGIKIDDKLNL